MLEIVFNESAAGSLKCGIGRGIECGGVTAIAILHEDGHPATEEEQEAARKQLPNAKHATVKSGRRRSRWTAARPDHSRVLRCVQRRGHWPTTARTASAGNAWRHCAC